ncbi:MAG: YCF48-related protein [Paraperlucidibaca sp.]
MSKAIPALFLVFVAATLSYAFSHRSGPPLPATEVQLTTTMMMSVAEVGNLRVGVGERGRIFRQAAADAPWQSIKSPTEATLTRVVFFNAKRGLAVGHDSVILLTNDGGLTWGVVHNDPEFETPLLDIAFVDASHAFAIGAYGLFMESKDGGKVWEARAILPEGGDRHLNAIAKLGDGTFVIVGELGMILRSADTGATWQPVVSPYQGTLFGVRAVGGSDVVGFGMRGKIVRSSDSGVTFTEVASPVTTSLFGSSLSANGQLLLVGQSGEILSSRDGGVSFSQSKVEGSPMLTSVIETASGALAFGEQGAHPISFN